MSTSTIKPCSVPDTYIVKKITSVHNNVVFNAGGVIKFGKVAIVGIKITVNAEIQSWGTQILGGFYTPTSDGVALPMMGLGNGRTISGRLSGVNFYPNQAVPTGEYWISGAYIC